MELNSITRDLAAIEQGAWVDEIPEMGELRLKVRGLGNADHQRMMGKLTTAVPRAKKLNGRVDPVEMDRVIATCAHATLLLDWDGVTLNGEPVPYDKELAFRICMDPAKLDFVKAILWAAQEVAEMKADAEKADAGN